MSFPPIQMAWTISYNNAINGVSLNAMMGNYLFTVSQFFLANGLSCKGSCDGTTGAMDGVNRWLAPADCDTRGANTTSANSWMVMTNGNGVDILLSYVGAGDDNGYIGFSPDGLYVAAGTATFTPTASDQVLLSNFFSLINPTVASNQRNLFMWVDSEAKLMRVLLTNDGAGANPTGLVWGVEEFDDTLQDKTVNASTWGFFYQGRFGTFCLGPGSTAGFMGAFSFVDGSVQGGRCRVNGQQVDMNGGLIEFNGAFAGSTSLPWSNILPELQGGLGYPIWGPLRVASRTTSNIGVVARLYDWWTCRYNGSGTSLTGDTYNALNFIAVGLGGGLLWPGDGSTVPNLGSAAGPQLGEHTGFENADDPAYARFMNGASMYVPLPGSRVTPTGPTDPKSIDRRPGVEVIELIEMPTDPTADPSRGQLYFRMIDGQQALFVMYPDGSVYEVGAGGA